MLKQVGQFTAVGIEMGIALVLGILGGGYIDKKLGTDPVFFWIGFTVGLLAAGKAVYDAVQKAKKVMDKK